MIAGLVLVIGPLFTLAGQTADPEFHRGVNHAHIHRNGRGYGSAVSAAELAHLRSIGVDWIAITPFGYQRCADADRLAGYSPETGRFSGADRTMSDVDLRREIDAAHRLGIRVHLKPHIWSDDFWDGDEWHGTVRQADGAAHLRWWAGYRSMMLHYGRMAQEAKADMLCVGTELVNMTAQHSGEWRALIADLRRVYTGPLTYAAHWQAEFDRIQFWNALDAIGINAYFPLDAPAGADVQQLTEAWAPHLSRVQRLQEKYGKPVLFMEAGYRPVVGAHIEPWSEADKDADDQAQARAYEALFSALDDAPWWHGVYLWKTYTDPQRASRRRRGRGFNFRGRPAEAVVKSWYLEGGE